jgi:hypothetical protein
MSGPCNKQVGELDITCTKADADVYDISSVDGTVCMDHCHDHHVRSIQNACSDAQPE